MGSKGLRYRYPNGATAHLHYPGGAYVRKDYTARGQSKATGWDDDDNNWWMKLAAYTYLSDGKVGQVDYGNGMRSAIGYDGRGFAQIVDHYNIPLNQEYSWRQYTRDTRDRIISFQKSYNLGSNPMEDGRGDRFHYDDEGQLLEGWYNATDPANSGAGNTRYDGFGYDALGNRGLGNYVASRGQMDFTKKDNGLNQYRSWWPYSYTNYDDDISGWGSPGQANGVLMQDGWITAGFNALNQPMYIWSANVGWTYFGYDPLGRCVKRWVGDSGDVYSNPATYFHYDGWNLLQEGANAWGPARVYVHGNRIDEIVWSYNTFTGDQAFHHYDARGHCTLLTDSLGNILEQYEYDAFGWPYFYDATGTATYVDSQPGSPFGNRFLFTGREWLSDLHLYDYRNRMYQPELGRFLQPDPKEFGAGDYNLYRYCHNDPVNNADPMGLYVSGLTSWGGGDWIRGINGITNRDNDLINQARLHDFLNSEKTKDAARDAARASHSTGVEHGAAFGNKGPNDIALGPTTASTDDPQKNVEGRHGVFNTTDFARKSLPPGYTLRGGVWGLVRHQDSWPTGDRQSLWEHHMSGVLGIPAQDGSQNRRPEVLVYEYSPGSAAPPRDD